MLTMKEPLCTIHDRCEKDNCRGYNEHHINCPIWKVEEEKYKDVELLKKLFQKFGKIEGERLFKLMMRGEKKW